MVITNGWRCHKDRGGLGVLQTRFNFVEARAACAAGIWVDMQRWQHLEDGGDGSLGGEMGLNMSLTRRM